MARHTLFAYVEGFDLEHVHDRIVESLVGFVDSHAWRVLTPRVVDQRFLGDSGLGPGDLPQWDLGLNVDLPDPGDAPPGWIADVEDVVRCIGRLHVDVERYFVIGLHDHLTGVNEDLFYVNTEKPDLAAMWKILGVGPTA